MKKSVKTQKFNYPIDEVKSLLLDVDNYKNFIPMCYYEAELLEKTPTFQKALIKLKIPLLKVELITDYKIIDDNNIEVSMQGGVSPK
ncbi:hypothetical protein AB9G26_04550 [Francisella philomiragia]|uniref:hypothetical protein n=1 Tax=Francisella philomiragia TaxID=28110 RepID=UPI003510E268